ncbi:TPA: hydrogenase maturation nickel metallochaperone HypA [Thermoplasmata archaeon]|nr:hydrogenase maturation nickel metallochaperone HypA [Thermoplasmata archaeon]
MSQIVDAITEEAVKRGATKVEGVTIELGEFTMLGEQQMKFAFEVLSKGTIMENAVLEMRKKAGEIECSCGFRGGIALPEDAPHRAAPILECPTCGGGATIVSGRECVIRDIRMVVPDV